MFNLENKIGGLTDLRVSYISLYLWVDNLTAITYGLLDVKTICCKNATICIN